MGFSGQGLGTAHVTIDGDLSKLSRSFGKAKGMTSSAVANMSQRAKIGLGLNTGAFSRGLGGAHRSLNVAMVRMQGLVKTAAAGMVTSLQGVSLAAAGVGVGITGALTAIAVKGLRDFSRFQTGIATVSTMVKENVDENMKSLSSGVTALSLVLPHTTSLLSEGLYDILSASVPLSYSLEALKLSGQAAVAGISDVKTAANLATGTINGLGMSFADMKKVMDLSFSAVREGKLTFSELAGSIGRAIPAANKMGASAEELYSSMAFLTKNTLSSEMAATALATAYDQLAAKSADLEGMGVRVFGDAGEYRGIVAIVTDIAKQLEGLTQQAQVNVLEEMGFEQRAARATVTMTNNLDHFKQTVADVSDSAGAMQEAFDKLKGTLQNQWKLLRNSLTNLSVTIGDKFDDTAVAAIKSMTELVNNVSTIIGAEGLTGIWEKHGDAVVAIFDHLAATALATMGQMFGAMGDMAKLYIKRLGADLAFAAKDAPRRMVESSIATMKGLTVGLVREGFSGVWTELDKADAKAQERWRKQAATYDSLTGQIINSMGQRAKAASTVTGEGVRAAIAELDRVAGKVRSMGDQSDQAVGSVESVGKATGDLASEVGKLNASVTSGSAALGTWTERLAEAQAAIQAMNKAIQNVERAQAAQKQVLTTWSKQLGEIAGIARETIDEKLKAYQFRPVKFPLQMQYKFTGRTPQEIAETAISGMKVVTIQPELAPMGRIDTSEIESQIDETIRRLGEPIPFKPDTAGWFQGLSEAEAKYWQDRVKLAENSQKKLKELKADYLEWYEKKLEEQQKQAEAAYRAEREIVERELYPVRGAFEGLFSDMARNMGDFENTWARFWQNLSDIALDKMSQITADIIFQPLTEALTGQRIAKMAGTGTGTAAGLAIGTLAGTQAGFPAGMTTQMNQLGTTLGLPAAETTSAATIGTVIASALTKVAPIAVAYGAYRVARGFAEWFGGGEKFEAPGAALSEGRKAWLQQVGGASDEAIKDLEIGLAEKYGESTDLLESINADTSNLPGMLAELRKINFKTKVSYGVTTPGFATFGGVKSEPASWGFASVGGIKSDIPSYAFGGIATRPQVAMVGEAGPEAIIPLRHGVVSMRTQQPIVNRTVIENLNLHVNAEFPNARLDTMTNDQFMDMLDNKFTYAVEEWIERGSLNRLVR